MSGRSGERWAVGERFWIFGIFGKVRKRRKGFLAREDETEMRMRIR